MFPQGQEVGVARRGKLRLLEAAEGGGGGNAGSLQL